MNPLTRFRLWRKAILSAPFLVAGLYLYIGLPSSYIFPEGNFETLQPWHPGYLGWYDLVLGFALIASVLSSRVHIPGANLGIGAVVLVAIVASVALTDWSFAWNALFDDVTYWFRFFATFIAFVTLVIRLGERSAEKVLIGMVAVMMLTSLFVFRLLYGSFNRIYASGMTVGSFSQAMLILSLIAMVRGNKSLMLVAILFLVLTFSRTAVAVWMLCLLYYFLSKSQIDVSRRLVIGSLSASLFALALFFLTRNPEFQFVIDDRLDPESISTFNMRFVVWQYGLELMLSDGVPMTGIGFHCTPSVLIDYMPGSLPEGGLGYIAASFHNIILEYGIGLGLLALPIFGVLLWRIWTTWRSKCYLPFLIFTVFLVTQSFDFTFYRPKEVVMWGAFLGFGEGQWRLHRRRRAVQPWKGTRLVHTTHAGLEPAVAEESGSRANA